MQLFKMPVMLTAAAPGSSSLSSSARPARKHLELKPLNLFSAPRKMNLRLAVSKSLVALAMLLFQAASAQVVIYPTPAGEPQSTDYQVWVNGQPVFGYTSYEFDPNSSQTLNGRPVAPLTFASFDFQGTVTVTVAFGSSLTQAGINTSTVTIRPLASGLAPTVTSSNTITFQLSQPCQLSIEPGGQTARPLHLFANALETNAPNPAASNVKSLAPGIHTAADIALSGGQTILYFQPGVHQSPSISPVNGETIYVAGGAVVELEPITGLDPTNYSDILYGIAFAGVNPLINARWVNNVTVRGRGVLSARIALLNQQRAELIHQEGGGNITIEGVTVRDPGGWSVNLVNSSSALVQNLKVIGYFVNSDGVAIGGTSHATVRDSFCHNADDAFEIKTWISQQDVTFTNCVCWSDVGTCFGLAWENGASVSNVWFKDCTAIHDLAVTTAQPAVGICVNNPGSGNPGSVSGVTFQNIVVEHVAGSLVAPLKVVNNWPTTSWQITVVPTQPGNPYVPLNPPAYSNAPPISNVIFSNIQVLNSANSDIAVVSAGSFAPVQNVSFYNVSINGSPVSGLSFARLFTNQWVSGLTITQTVGTVVQQLVNAQFGPTNYSTYQGAGPVIGSATDYWNPLISGSGGQLTYAFGPLKDSGGNSTAVNITLSNNTWTDWVQWTWIGPYQNLYSSYILERGPNTITISGLSNACKHDIYLINGPYSGASSTATVNGISKTMTSDGSGWNTAWVAGNQFCVFTNMATDGFGKMVISLTSADASYPIAGLQIVQLLTVTGTNSIASIVGGNPTTFTAHGVSGYTYVAQRATNLVSPNWVPISTNTADANGLISVLDDFHDLASPPPFAYYRLRWTP